MPSSDDHDRTVASRIIEQTHKNTIELLRKQVADTRIEVENGGHALRLNEAMWRQRLDVLIQFIHQTGVELTDEVRDLIAQDLEERTEQARRAGNQEQIQTMRVRTRLPVPNDPDDR